MLERLFRLTENKTSVRTEVVAGLTIFVTMAYIIVVNPAILSFAGIPAGPSTVATILAAAIGCLLMAFLGNRPIAVAPYMGENAFIAFGLASLPFHISWEQRLGAVFVSGAVFVLLTVTHVRSWLVDAISLTMKQSIAVGVGLFLSFIGLYQTGIITGGGAGLPYKTLLAPGSDTLLRAPDVPVKIGDLHEPGVLLAVAGFVLIALLMHYRIKGAILIGVAATGIAGILIGISRAPEAFVAMPFTGDYALSPIFAKMQVLSILHLGMLPVLITLVLMAFLDTTGTLMGLGAAGGMLDEKGNFPQVERPMLVDALSCMIAPVLGTSTTGAFIESATGIREGARTGLAALVVGLLFALSLFFIPLLRPMQTMAFAYGPALLAVGLLMMSQLKQIEFEDMTEVLPAFATIVMMVFTFNIANGLTAGLVLYPLMKVLGGRARQVRPGSYLLAALCLVYFIWGQVH
jgi:AGZA family xanthine/uracil permease-like MFS transporter